MTKPRTSKDQTTLTRRGLFRRVGGAMAVGLFASGIVLQPRRAHAGSITLDPTTDPSTQGYATEGNAPFTPGPRLQIDDGGTDRCVFFKGAPEIETGAVTVDVDVQIDEGSVVPAGEDTGVHFVLNSGQNVGVEIRVACIRRGVERRIAMKTSAGDFSPGLLADWTVPLKVHIERTAAGDGRISIGAASETLPPTSLALASRAQATFEFGCFLGIAQAVATFGPIGVAAVLPATVYVNPQTINTKAKGQYITVYIETDGSWNVADIDITTVTLQAIDPVTSAALPVAVNAATEIGDGNHNEVVDRMVKFDRATVQSWFASDTVATFRVAGQLVDGRVFQGQTTATIINAGG